MDKEKLAELARKVAEHRREIDITKTEKATAEELMRETPLGKAFQLSEQHLRREEEALSEAEAELKAAGVTFYNETKERKPIDGVEVKIFKLLKYDSLKVLAWCRKNATTLLKLDKKPFEKAAVAIGAPVKVEEEPRCSLATDLSGYLEPAAKVETE